MTFTIQYLMFLYYKIHYISKLVDFLVFFLYLYVFGVIFDFSIFYSRGGFESLREYRFSMFNQII